MFRSKAGKNIVIIAVLFALCGTGLIIQLTRINFNRDYYSAFDLSAPREVTLVCSYGDIYDRHGEPLVNTEETYIAAINPDTADRAELDEKITDRDKYESCIDGSALFLCEVNTKDISSADVITVKKRYSEDQPAAHIIGYTGEECGVCGLEMGYDDILRQPRSTVTLIYSTDAKGDMLEGSGLSLKYTSSYETGLLTSIDKDIQQICEKAMANVEKGAAIVMDIATGELCAVVSKPVFDPIHPENSLDNADSPFINRAFSAYSVGSIFKLITAGAAVEYGISDSYSYNCTGSIRIRQNEFGCHLFGGHGNLNMRMAMVQSCNPYFIALGRDIPTDILHDFAEKAGFGSQTRLCSGIYSASGYLTSEEELAVPEEKANFCFGQGKLTATPLQITLLTAAIANEGMEPKPILVHGTTDIAHESAAAAIAPAFERVMERSTADKLRSFMISTIYKDNSTAVPEHTTGGGKTSTAQTWTYDEYGREKLNCWFTGFFPAIKPRYAVTIMIEEGVSGNLTCGPVFKEIADEVFLMESSAYQG